MDASRAGHYQPHVQVLAECDRINECHSVELLIERDKNKSELY